MDHKTTMAQMVHFSFPYYFTILNSEIRKTNWTLGYTIYFNSANLWVMWVRSSIQQTVIQRVNGYHMVRTQQYVH